MIDQNYWSTDTRDIINLLIICIIQEYLKPYNSVQIIGIYTYIYI